MNSDLVQDSLSFLRRHLQEDDNSVDTASASSGDNAFDPKVFWSVNALIFFIIVGSCIWYCKFGNLLLTEQSRSASDEAYRQTVLERQQRRLERKRDSPEKRRKRLTQSFQRQSVSMVSNCLDSSFSESSSLVDSEQEAVCHGGLRQKYIFA